VSERVRLGTWMATRAPAALRHHSLDKPPFANTAQRVGNLRFAKILDREMRFSCQHSRLQSTTVQRLGLQVLLQAPFIDYRMRPARFATPGFYRAPGIALRR
jgi:hypothetical protein